MLPQDKPNAGPTGGTAAPHGQGGQRSMSVNDSTSRRYAKVAPSLYERDGKFVFGYSDQGRWRWKTLKATKLSDAKREVTSEKYKVDSGRAVAPSRQTLDSVAAEYFADLDARVKSGEVSERTAGLY